MARNIFFSFDFDDVCATNVVRNSNIVRAENMVLPFRDHSMYEKVKNTPATIRAAIDLSLRLTSVTVIAHGGSTYASGWVRYEIAKSLERGNTLMVVDVNGVGLEPQPTKGPNPLGFIAAYPWEDGRGFDIREWNGQQWVSFSKLSSVTREESKYPADFYHGAPCKLLERFKFHKHWNDLEVKMYFKTYVDLEAKAAGH
jgi:hypothetical protein